MWARRSAGPATLAAYAGAAAFVIAAGWFWLATENVTTYPPPRIGPHVPALGGMRIYYRWQATTLPQERYYTVIAFLGFIGLAIAVGFIRDVAARGRALSTTGAVLVGLGAATWVIGSILKLGGHRAVGLMAAHTNPRSAAPNNLQPRPSPDPRVVAIGPHDPSGSYPLTINLDPVRVKACCPRTPMDGST